jgi:hypothetical protein
MGIRQSNALPKSMDMRVEGRGLAQVAQDHTERFLTPGHRGCILISNMTTFSLIWFFPEIESDVRVTVGNLLTWL